MSQEKLWKPPPSAEPLAAPRAFFGAPTWFTFLFSKDTGKQASPGPLRVPLKRPVRPFTAALVPIYTRHRGRPRACLYTSRTGAAQRRHLGRTRDRRQRTHVGDKLLKRRRASVNFANSNLGIKLFSKTPLFWWLNIINNHQRSKLDLLELQRRPPGPLSGPSTQVTRVTRRFPTTAPAPGRRGRRRGL